MISCTSYDLHLLKYYLIAPSCQLTLAQQKLYIFTRCFWSSALAKWAVAAYHFLSSINVDIVYVTYCPDFANLLTIQLALVAINIYSMRCSCAHCFYCFPKAIDWPIAAIFNPVASPNTTYSNFSEYFQTVPKLNYVLSISNPTYIHTYVRT